MKVSTGYLRNSNREDLFVQITHVDAARGLWILCPPLLEEATYCRLDYRGISKSLVTQGYTVVEFDYSGTGDSTGSHLDATLSKRRNDIIDIGNACSDVEGHHQLFLFGMRFGGNLCLEASGKCNTWNAIAWYPIVSGQEYVDELLKINVSTQYAAYSKIKTSKSELLHKLEQGESINVLGFEIGQDLMSEISKTDLMAQVDNLVNTTIVLQKNRHSAELRENLAHQGSRVIEDSVRPFWQAPRILDPDHKKILDETLSLIDNA